MERSPEFELVLACARSLVGGGLRDTLRARAGGALDWGQVQSLAFAHGVLPIVRRQLTEAGALPGQAQEGFARMHAGIVARGAVLLRELGRVLSALEAAGVEVLVYKGPALGAQVFGDPQARVFQDLDLLVRPADFARARAVLLDAGYRRLHGEDLPPQAILWRSECDDSFVDPAGNVLVELHWSVAPPYFSVPLATEALFDRRVPVALGEHQAWAPGLPDLLLLLALNGTKEGWCRLEPILCIGALVQAEPALPWSEIQARAGALRLERMWHVGLLLADRLLGAPVAGDARRAAEADGHARHLTGQVIERLHRGQVKLPSVLERSRLILRSRERLRDRVRFCLLRALTPTRKDAAAVRLPEALWPAYYLLRPVRVLASMAFRRTGGLK